MQKQVLGGTAIIWSSQLTISSSCLHGQKLASLGILSEIRMSQNETILVTLLESLQCVISGNCDISCVHENEKKSSIFHCFVLASSSSDNGVKTSSCR